MKVAARVISFVFHPLLLTTYLVLVLGYFFPPMLGIKQTVLYKFALFIFIITFMFPGLCMMFTIRFSGGTSLQMNSRKDRVVPFVLMTFLYIAVTALFLYKGFLGMNFSRLMMIIAALVTLSAGITFFYKISVHSLAMGGGIGILLALNRIADANLLGPIVVAIVIAGVVMSSRLLLNAHTLREVMTGALAGLVAGMAGMMILF